MHVNDKQTLTSFLKILCSWNQLYFVFNFINNFQFASICSIITIIIIMCIAVFMMQSVFMSAVIGRWSTNDWQLSWEADGSSVFCRSQFQVSKTLSLLSAGFDLCRCQRCRDLVDAFLMTQECGYWLVSMYVSGSYLGTGLGMHYKKFVQYIKTDSHSHWNIK